MTGERVDPRPKLRADPDPITPISDEKLNEIRERWAGTPTVGYHAAADVNFLLARLDAAEAKVRSLALEVIARTEDHAAANARYLAALASPEGVVTLPKLGQRVRITTDDGMDHVGEVIRYGDPEGNVRTLFMVALDDGSSGYFLDEPSWHWTLVPYRPEDTKGAGYE